MGLRSWYDNTVLPKVVAAGCGTDDVAELRRHVVPQARGAVLELGCGGGYNQPLYDRTAITSFTGIDPNAALLEAARRSAAHRGYPVDLREGTAEDLPYHDGAFDTVVCTYTLCSVGDPARALAEVRRVLKPGGRMLYLEHGRAPDPAPAKWQRRIEPVWKHLAGNCHLTRDTGSMLRAAGFDVQPIGRGYFDKATKWAGWMEWGVAQRAGA